ncbi:tyrosinase family oxidase copper chaperone [Streptomyces olivaceus]|uniref:tyrosinase family oxidase copper chaperone n=1 Tax=Streptomyces olivaceus TaxID=47716 RepID=UPI0036E6A455
MVVNAGAPVSGAERKREHPPEGGGLAGNGSSGGGAADGGPASGGAASAAAASGTRRQMMRGLLAPALAVTLVPLVVASRPFRAEATAQGADAAPPGPRAAERAGQETGGTAFDETYRGRRIRGIRSAAGRAVGAGTWHVTVDGRPLHLMRRADGSWLSMIDHYRSYPTPLEAARGAVDELGPAEQVRDTPGDDAGHDHHTGGRHGVHA